MRYGALAASVVLAFLLGCAATETGREADRAVTADAVSTGAALGLVQGAVEANPLALPLLPLRYSMSRRLEKERCVERRSAHALLSGTAYAATGNNLLVLVGASFPPLGLIAGIPIYVQAMRKPCVPVFLDVHVLLLARWWDAYTQGNVPAMEAITDNDELVAAYADLFARTESRTVVYWHMESVRDGFIVDYDATVWFPDGESRSSKGELRFEVVANRIVAVEEHS